MKLSDHWFTSLSEDESGRLIFITGRLDLDLFRTSGKLRIRVEITWPYRSDDEGMPLEADATLIAEIEPLLRKAMERDKLAILTGNYTGAGQKVWVWYTRHLPSFGQRLNEVLQPYETLPLDIHCEEDDTWDEYRSMLAMQSQDLSEE